MDGKQRLSVTVDADLAEDARRAVADERAPSLSEHVRAALRREQTGHARQAVFASFIEEWESQDPMSDDERDALVAELRQRSRWSDAARP